MPNTLLNKWFEPTYIVVLVASIEKWLLDTVSIASSITALIIAIMTIFYVYSKYKGQLLDNEIKFKELELLNQKEERLAKADEEGKSDIN